MTKLRIVGWRPGLRTVSLVLLVKDRVTGSLANAKRLVDTLLDGTEIELPFESPEQAESFRVDAEVLGAVVAACETSTETDDSVGPERHEYH